MKWEYEKACIEAGMEEEKIRELRKEFDDDRRKLNREKQRMKRNGVCCVGLNRLLENRDLDIPDSISVEEIAIKNLYLKQLRECLQEMDSADRDLVIAYFDKNTNFSQYARDLGAKRADLIYRVNCIVRQLRKKMQI